MCLQIHIIKTTRFIEFSLYFYKHIYSHTLITSYTYLFFIYICIHECKFTTQSRW